MKYSISPDIAAINPPPITEVRRWLENGRHRGDVEIIDLCQAVPSYAPPVELIEHLRQQLLDAASYRYSADEGLPEVRAGLCEHYRRRYQAIMEPDNLCLTIGASQAFWLAMVTLCRRGDEVVVVVPYYFDHVMALDALGIRSVFVPFDEESGGLVEARAIASRINSRTRAIVLVTPSNPTGVITPPELLEEIFTLARKNDIALILDETYAEFIPGNAPPHGLLSRADWEDGLIHLASFGKTFALTGLRAGALVAASQFIEQALKAQDSMVVCAPRPTQHAILYGVRHLRDWVAEKRQLMDQRHRLFGEEFSRAGNPFKLVASGSFFAWVRHPFPSHTGRQVSRLLLEEAGVLTLGGEIFGPGLTRYLRIALGNIDEAAIVAAVRRFRELRV